MRPTFPKAGSLASREAPLHLQHGDGIASLPPQLYPPAISYTSGGRIDMSAVDLAMGGTQLTTDFLTIHHFGICYFCHFRYYLLCLIMLYHNLSLCLLVDCANI